MKSIAHINDMAASNDMQVLEPAFKVLADISPSSVWLANFTSKQTQATYRNAVAQFITAFDIKSDEELYDVQQSHVIAFRDHLKTAGQSNASIATKLSALSSLYKFLADKQLCVINPVSGVTRPSTDSQGIGGGKTPALTRKQVWKMLDAPDVRTLKGLRDRAILSLFFFTGGRCSEPAKLKVKDFKVHQGYWVVEFTVKGDKTNRVALAPIYEDSPTLFEYDQGHECAEALFDYLSASRHSDDLDAPLFLAVKKGNNTGGLLTRKTLHQIFKHYAQKVGLPLNITPHSARASFITQCYEQGIKGEDIQRSVAHSSITTTEAYNQSRKKLSDSASLLVSYR